MDVGSGNASNGVGLSDNFHLSEESSISTSRFDAFFRKNSFKISTALFFAASGLAAISETTKFLNNTIDDVWYRFYNDMPKTTLLFRDTLSEQILAESLDVQTMATVYLATHQKIGSFGALVMAVTSSVCNGIRKGYVSYSSVHIEYTKSHPFWSNFDAKWVQHGGSYPTHGFISEVIYQAAENIIPFAREYIPPITLTHITASVAAVGLIALGIKKGTITRKNATLAALGMSVFTAAYFLRTVDTVV